MSIFFIVPTHFIVYKIADLTNPSREFVREFKTKGGALKWIYKSGEKGINYFVQENFRK